MLQCSLKHYVDNMQITLQIWKLMIYVITKRFFLSFHVPYQHRCPLTLLAQYLDEHDRGKLFLFQKYAQDALVRRKQHPPQLWNWDALNIWRLNKILTESEAVLPRLTFSQPQITWLFDSEFKLQLFRKSISNLFFIEFYRINQHIV